MGDDGAQGVRRKKDSSLVRAAEAVRDGKASAMVERGEHRRHDGERAAAHGTDQRSLAASDRSPVARPGRDADGAARRRRERRVPAGVAGAVRADGHGVLAAALRRGEPARRPPVDRGGGVEGQHVREGGPPPPRRSAGCELHREHRGPRRRDRRGRRRRDRRLQRQRRAEDPRRRPRGDPRGHQGGPRRRRPRAAPRPRCSRRCSNPSSSTWSPRPRVALCSSASTACASSATDGRRHGRSPTRSRSRARWSPATSSAVCVRRSRLRVEHPDGRCQAQEVVEVIETH